MSLSFYENRNTRVRVRFTETEDGVTEPVPIFAASNLVPLFRAFKLDDTLVMDEEMDKIDPVGDPEKEGIAEKWILFDSEYDQALIIRFILRDDSVADPNTLSNQREEVYSEIKRKVYSSP